MERSCAKNLRRKIAKRTPELSAKMEESRDDRETEKPEQGTVELLTECVEVYNLLCRAHDI